MMQVDRPREGEVARIAAPGDQRRQTAAPAVDSFPGTPVPVFAGAEAAARAWPLETPPEPGRVTLLPQNEAPLMGVRARGRLRDADHESLPAPLRAHLPEEGGIRLLVVADDGGRGWTPEACLDDIAAAVSPCRGRVETLAAVAGPRMLRRCAGHVPSALPRCPVTVFGRDGRGAAWASLPA